MNIFSFKAETEETKSQFFNRLSELGSKYTLSKSEEVDDGVNVEFSTPAGYLLMLSATDGDERLALVRKTLFPSTIDYNKSLK